MAGQGMTGQKADGHSLGRTEAEMRRLMSVSLRHLGGPTHREKS